MTTPPLPGVSIRPEDHPENTPAAERVGAMRGIIQNTMDSLREEGVHGLTSVIADTRPIKDQVREANRVESSNGGKLDDQSGPASQQYFNRAATFLAKHEGRRSRVYDDATGKPLLPGDQAKGNRTIGVGLNLEPKGARKMVEAVGADYDKVLKGEEVLSDPQIDQLLIRFMKRTDSWLRREFQDTDMEGHRWMALLSLAYNSRWKSGRPTLIGPLITAAIKRGDWEVAEKEIRENSEGGVPEELLDGIRARRLSESLMFRGVN